MGKRHGDRRPRTLYHFTSVHHLSHIKADGFLKATESNLSFLREHAGPDVVWFLDTPTADDAPHGLVNAYVDKKAVRISVRAVGERWLDWVVRQPGFDADTMDILIRTGGGDEAAAHWWVVEGKVRASAWMAQP